MGVVPPKHLLPPAPSCPTICCRHRPHHWDGPWPVFLAIIEILGSYCVKHFTYMGPGWKLNFSTKPLIYSTSTLKSIWGNSNWIGTVLNPGEGVCLDPVERDAILEVKGPGPPRGVSERQLSPDRGGERTWQDEKTEGFRTRACTVWVSVNSLEEKVCKYSQ